MKLRIAAAAAAGILLIGILAWPIASPQEPLGIVSQPGLRGGFVLIILAFFTGILGYFFSWPYGREIGILAVPAGLCVWAIRGGSIANVIQQHPAIADRQAFYSALRWEPFFWLAVVGAGFLAVYLAHKLIPNSTQKESVPQEMERRGNLKSRHKPNVPVPQGVNVMIAVIGSIAIAHIFISMFAQDVRLPDKWLGYVIAQPAKGQIVFAVLAGFAAAAFVVKKFLDSSYVWPASASVLLMFYACFRYARPEILRYLAQEHPANFFSSALVCILPVQMVALAAIGSVAGYWLAVRFNYWREHEID
jgi:hypothetical protein